MQLQAIWTPIKETVSDFLDDKAQRLAAAIAYYTIFSLAPMLIIVIGIAGLVWGREAVQGELASQLSGVLGEKASQQIQSMVQNASKPGSGTWAIIIGSATLLFGALGTFTQLKDALNTIWEVKIKPMKGWRGAWVKARTYLLSFAMILVIAFLLLTSLVVSTALAAMGKWLADALPLPSFVLESINVIVSFGVVTLLFAAIFKWLPDVRISWRDVWMGAAVTAALFVIGKFALGMYLGRGSVTSVYGAAGSIIVILLWVYYSSLILLFGAEFTQVYSRRWGERIRPSAIAEYASVDDRAAQGMPAKRSRRECKPGRFDDDGDDRRGQAQKPSIVAPSEPDPTRLVRSRGQREQQPRS